MNKPNGFAITSYYRNDRSKIVKNTKIKPRIYMVMAILIIVVTIIIMTKAITLMKTATKTVTKTIIK